MYELALFLVGAVVGGLITFLVLRGRLKELKGEVELMELRIKEEVRKARKDSLRRSAAVVSGLVAEKLAPFIADFPCDPRDCRFIGSPVDYVCFDGLSGGEVKELVIVEVKHGDSRLSGRELSVRRAVDSGSVSFKVVRIKKP